ncbi:TPA: spermidine synthase [candidate division WOR-3 bacterium]|jgi:spermidine synthase|uniref:Polyamine aminopropyltransferase n=1 Tax=candidate division WOR-3 bacterium TaxID=2052148 RepID=A0A350H7P6_UNCW3|nr:spermidine synthase [candidate division WOR-3 bacterium]
MEQFNKSQETHLWYTEYHTPNSGITLKVKETLLRVKSPYQELVILDTYEYGKMMLLDGLVMLTERDEFIYHEMITHMPVNVNPNIKKALIIGGGDCGTLRELSKYPFIENIKMVEIDEEVVKASKKYFPQLTSGLSKNSEIIIGDGIDFVEKTNEIFDLIIIDSTDPIGPAEGLFTDAFYSNCRRILSENGMMVLQAESPYFHADSIKIFSDRLKRIFGFITPYIAFIPTYPSGMWEFIICTKKELDTSLKSKSLIGDFEQMLKYYNHDVHSGAFKLPTFVKKIYGI